MQGGDMRILLWHGYLLGGTGSNVYTRALAREWSLQGHEVVVVCQEPAPEQYDLGGAQVVRPALPGGLLPVFVLDRYEGLTARLLQDFTAAERAAYVEANVEALRALLPAELVFTNHVLMGGAVGAGVGERFRVKAHGSELEYSMRGRPELEAWGREVLAPAEAVFVGSQHIRRVLAEVTGHVDSVLEVPPGVDVDAFVPQSRAAALADLVAEARNDLPNPGNVAERLPDEGNAERLAAFLAGERPTVVYFGKLIENKGVQLLLEALASLEARAVIVGFGDYRGELEARAAALPPGRVLFTGPLEHRHLVHLLPLADAAVVPSIFPEAFGMVAAEAAACGCPPLVARHSGLAEVAAGLEESYPVHLRGLASFTTGDAAELREKLAELLALPDSDRQAIRAAARATACERWSWAGVAARLLAPVA
ncbi:MAG TPA: glycosyltransferase family 4 protein [Gaiellaceae bacterium]|nr:glycosyltransferase family 4 protein [Gaiellaceae bacterium]